MRIRVIALIGCITVAGCAKPAAPTEAEPAPVAGEKKLDDLRLSIHIEGVADEAAWKAIQESAEMLLDEDRDGFQITPKAGYGDARFLGLAPVTDVAAAAAKLDFGEVLAVDVKGRAIVVDASGPRAELLGAGVFGSAGVNAFIGRKRGEWAAKQADAEIVKKFGAERAVVVCLPGSIGEGDAEFEALDRIAPIGDGSTAFHPSEGPDLDNVIVITFGPIATFDDAVKAFPKERVAYADAKSRTIVLNRQPK